MICEAINSWPVLLVAAGVGGVLGWLARGRLRRSRRLQWVGGEPRRWRTRRWP